MGELISIAAEETRKLFSCQPQISFKDLDFFGRLKPMPRVNPIPEAERSICERVHLARKSSGFTRVEVARRAGVDSGYLAGVEHARNPLKYSLAYRIITLLRINPAWLLFGVGSMTGPAVLLPPEALGTEARQTFSEVYSKQFVLAQNADASDRLKKIAKQSIDRQIDEWLSELPGERVDFFVRQLVQAGTAYLTPVAPAQLPRAPLSRPGSADLNVDTISVNRNDPLVPLTLAKLLDRARNLTSPHGRKKELAKFLGVPPSRVSEWLSGVCEPGGEVAFRLLSWVEDQEKKPKAPASSETTRERRPTHHKDSNETGQQKPPSPLKGRNIKRKA
jgi:transcriptional regulator with XRE-family HTH domain